MSILLSLLALVGCAPRALDDQAGWEEAVASAAATVPDLTSSHAAYSVSGGLSEMREMVVSGTVDATSTTELDPIADAIEKAVAPAVVDLPVKGASLRITLTGRAATGAVAIPTLSRTVMLTDLATRYNLPRGMR